MLLEKIQYIFSSLYKFLQVKVPRVQLVLHIQKEIYGGQFSHIYSNDENCLTDPQILKVETSHLTGLRFLTFLSHHRRACILWWLIPYFQTTYIWWVFCMFYMVPRLTFLKSAIYVMIQWYLQWTDKRDRVGEDRILRGVVDCRYW